MRGAPGAAVVGYGDDITDADLERYLGVRRGPPQPQQQPQQEADIEYTLPLGVRPAKRPAPPDIADLLKDYKGAPISLNAERLPAIPYDIYSAALTLLDGDRLGDLKLTRQFAAELRQLTTGYKHEYHGIDPLVLISDTFTLPSGLVLYVEEAVAISLVLLATFLQCTVQLPGVASSSRPYAEVQLKAYEGRLTEGCQRFALAQQVHNELEQRGFSPAKVLHNMQIYMLRAGSMSSQEATDALWIEDCLQQMAGSGGGVLE